jgi:hypothetical protein
VSFVLTRVAEARERSADALVCTEQRLDFSRWVPEGFGTGDVVVLSDGVLEIIDLKFGKGVPVSPEGNRQMMLYALGTLAAFSPLFDIDTVCLSISQPRISNTATAMMSAHALLRWAEDVLRPTAALAYAGEGEFKAGEHCRFCKVRATCRARADANLALAGMAFARPPLLTVTEIGEVLKTADELKAWVSDIAAHALAEAVNHGVRYPGWKLVEGRSNRVYADETAVAKALTLSGYPEDQIYTRKLKGITDMEKQLGRKAFAELLSGQVVKPEGKPCLVPESDKRPELSSTDSAKADFSE